MFFYCAKTYEERLELLQCHCTYVLRYKKQFMIKILCLFR